MTMASQCGEESSAAVTSRAASRHGEWRHRRGGGDAGVVRARRRGEINEGPHDSYRRSGSNPHELKRLDAPVKMIGRRKPGSGRVQRGLEMPKW